MSIRNLVLASVLLAFPAVSAAQSSAPVDDIPRTPWGAPDLQGVYDFGTAIPLQRPVELGDRAVLTDEEAAVLEQQAAELFNDEVNRDSLTPPNYNHFWFEFGTTVADTRQSSLIVDPPNGRIPPVSTAEEQRRAAQDDAGGYPVRVLGGGIGMTGPEDRGLAERCILGFNSGPPIVPASYNNYLQVFQTPDHVVIFTEMVHDARIIPLDGRPHLSASIRQWMGDSRARWEGDTLVIESSNFTPKRGYNISWMNVVGTGETMRLTERLTRVDADTLIYEYTYDNSEMFTQPFSASIPLARTEDGAVFEYACHEGNYGMRNILSGARSAGE